MSVKCIYRVCNSGLRTVLTSWLDRSSIYIQIVEICPVYNINVAINVPFLTTDYTFYNVWLLNIVYIKK